MSARPVAALSQCTARTTYISGKKITAGQRNARLGLVGRQGALICRATAEKEGTKQDEQLQVPDIPPAKDNATAAGPESIPTDSSSASDSEARLSTDEIAAQMAQLRAASQGQGKKEGMLEGVLEEVQLISWPAPQSALLNTLLVIAIVGGTSAVLFGVNTLLAEISRVVYRAL